MGFIVVVAGRAFSDSTKMRIRSQNMLISTEEAGQVASLLKEDISQMGTKTWAKLDANLENEIGLETSAQANAVYENYNQDENAANADFSSYSLLRENDNDTINDISFRKVFYESDGTYRAVQKIRWFAETINNTVVLKRSCETLDGIENNDCSGNEMAMAKDVHRFKLLPSKPGLKTTISECITSVACYSDTLMLGGTGDIFSLQNRDGYPSANISMGTNSVTLKNFPPIATAGDSPSNTSGQYYVGAKNGESGWQNCEPFDFKVGETYAVQFNIPYEANDCIPGSGSPSTCQKYSRMSIFRPDLDHLAIGLRRNGETISNVPDFLFYPPQYSSSPIERNFEFSVPSDISACLAITAAIYGQASAGQITFSNFKVYRKLDKVYHFEDTPDSNYNPGITGAHTRGKAAVKAFKLDLEINKKSEKSKATMVIPVPNNGIIVHPSAGGSI